MTEETKSISEIFSETNLGRLEGLYKDIIINTLNIYGLPVTTDNILVVISNALDGWPGDLYVFDPPSEKVVNA